MTRTTRLNQNTTRAGIALTAILIGMTLMVGAAQAEQASYPGMVKEAPGTKDPGPTLNKHIDKSSPYLAKGTNKNSPKTTKRIDRASPKGQENGHREKGSGMATGKRQHSSF